MTRSRQNFVRRDFLTGVGAGVAGALAAARATTAFADPFFNGRMFLEGANPSYAQQGEDLVMLSLLAKMGVNPPSYLDIGAFEPVECSNTYLFYRLGGRGVLVEPNVDLAPKLRRVRPRDATLNAGIGTTDDPAADFYVMADPQRHTFDKDVAELLQSRGMRIERVVKMPLVNINAVIAEHFAGRCPDVVSIDIEGLDYAVLKTLDFGRFRPKLICAETLDAATGRHNPDTVALLVGKGYEVRGMTFPNTIFVDAKVL